MSLYHNFMLFSALGVSLVGIIAVLIAGFVIRGRSRKAYQDKLLQLGSLYDELGERVSEPGTERYADRLLELSEKREKLETSKREMMEEADRLMDEIRSFLSELGV